jgi:hypothetical protein
MGRQDSKYEAGTQKMSDMSPAGAIFRQEAMVNKVTREFALMLQLLGQGGRGMCVLLIHENLSTSSPCITSQCCCEQKLSPNRPPLVPLTFWSSIYASAPRRPLQ